MWQALQDMLSGLTNVLQSFWAGLNGFFSWVRDHFGIVALALLVPLGGLAAQVYVWLTVGDNVRERVVAYLSHSDWLSGALRAYEWAERLNYVIPVEELIGALVVFLGMAASISVVRFLRFMIW